MKRNGSPDPILETDEHAYYFLTTLPVHAEFKNLLAIEGDQVSDQVSDQVIKVIKWLQVTKTRQEILLHLGLSNHTKNFNKYIQPALQQGYIQMTIPNKPRSRNQQYIITKKGLRFLQSLNKGT